MTSATLPSKDASIHQICDSHQNLYRRYAPDIIILETRSRSQRPKARIWNSTIPRCNQTPNSVFVTKIKKDASVEGRRMTLEIISWSTSMKVLGRAEIKLAIPGSAVWLVSVARHVTDCPKKHGISSLWARGHNKIYEAHMVHNGK